MNHKIKEKFALKLMVIICFLLISIILINLIKTPPAKGFELSIYDAYSPFFWYAIIFINAIAILILFISAISQESQKYWIIGFIISIYINSIFLLLPALRGYVIYGRGDTLTHLGYIRDILSIGHIGESNFYPIEHVFGTALISVVNFQIEATPYILFIIFLCVYVIGLSLLMRKNLNNYESFVILISLTIPLIFSYFHVNIHPNIFSLFFIPFVLYIYYRIDNTNSSKNQLLILLVVFSIFITFFHPLTTIFLIVVILTYGISDIIFKRKISHKNVIENYKFIYIALIMIIIFFMWYFSFPQLLHNFDKVINSLYSVDQTSAFTYQTETIQNAKLSIFQTLYLSINRYGAIFVLFLTTFYLIILVMIKRKSVPIDKMSFIFISELLIAILISLALFFGYFIESNPIRIMRLPIMMAIILISILIPIYLKPIENFKSNRFQGYLIFLFLFIILISLLSLSIGSVYNSPRTSELNAQVTNSEIQGFVWFNLHQDKDQTIYANSIAINLRFYDYLNGIDFLSDGKIKRYQIQLLRYPSHFGYDRFISIKEILKDKGYLITTSQDRINYLRFPRSTWEFTPRWSDLDYYRLKSDIAVNWIYTNGEFEVWIL